MRRNAQHHRTETRSIQRSVQILLTVCGIAFLLAGMVLAVSGASVSSAVGSVSDRIDDARQPTDGGVDTVDSGSADDGGTTDTETANETETTDDADNTDTRTGETDDADTQTDGTDSTDTEAGGNESSSTDESHVLTAVVESKNGDVIDNATVSVDTGSASTISQSVDGNGETEFDLEDGEYTITADADGYQPSETTVQIDGADETVTLTLEQQTQADSGTDSGDGSHTLAVTVKDENGTAVENATVEVEADSSFLGSSDTKQVGDDGVATFERSDGTYTVSADADGYRLAERTVTIDGDDEAITLTLESRDD
ncbi:carboxypeptidase regulatory-like domain-containing protein [Natrinema sp. HArc-T2]|uniref:carboxypeptidase regulatory-like domain-containing protein n=1 Tax=Natrinema sp. HArc-T2 TaxID=3242701 RepID=UPI00359D4886